jgi:CheY-like chemotaxis protein
VTISKLLYDEGYEVSTANDGFDALLHLQQAVPDLILSDLNMPQMSGRVAVRGATQIPRDFGFGLQRGVRFQCYT